VSTVAPALGREFDDAVLAGLAVDPARRPDALAFGAGLAAALGRWTRGGRHGAIVAPVAETATARTSPIPAHDATTAVAIPLTETASIGLTPSFTPDLAARGDAVGPAPMRSTTWAITLISIAAVVLAFGLIGSRLLSAAPTGSAEPGPSGAAPLASPSTAAVAASPSLSPSPSPSPTPIRTVAPTIDPAVHALDEVDAAISAARGGRDGLKGKDANELASRVAVVRRDLDSGDRPKALRDARELARRVRDRVEGLDDEAAHRLTAASAALVIALAG
jgi:hypothetical protein